MVDIKNMSENPFNPSEGLHESLNNFGDNFRKMVSDLPDINPLGSMDKSTLDSLRGMLRSEEIRAEMAEEMSEKWKREIQENQERKQREKEAHQSILGALAWQKWSAIWAATCALIASLTLIVSMFRW